MHEIGARIITDASHAELHGDTPHRIASPSGYAKIDGFAIHV